MLSVDCNRTGSSFNVYYISHKAKTSQPCIIYLHGLASYCFEGEYLLPYLKEEFSLCLYDLRGHGKNKSPLITYGIE